MLKEIYISVYQKKLNNSQQQQQQCYQFNCMALCWMTKHYLQIAVVILQISIMPVQPVSVQLIQRVSSVRATPSCVVIRLHQQAAR